MQEQMQNEDMLIILSFMIFFSNDELKYLVCI